MIGGWSEEDLCPRNGVSGGSLLRFSVGDVLVRGGFSRPPFPGLQVVFLSPGTRVFFQGQEYFYVSLATLFCQRHCFRWVIRVVIALFHCHSSSL